MKKIINSADKQYVPVDTENLVLDDTPTEGSFNAVTSDGVAKAIAGGGGGTEYSAGDGISIAEGEISAKVDGSTIGINASGELEALGGGGSSLEAGDAINIQNDKINVRVDVTSIQVKSDTKMSEVNDYTYDYRNIGLDGMTSGTKCDWAFGSDSNSFDITATAAQVGCEIHAALYDENSTRISVSTHGIVYWGMPKTLNEGTNMFYAGWNWSSAMRPSGNTFGTEFPLAEGKTYGDVTMIALVAYDSANSQVVGDPLPFTHNRNIQFKIETDANSRLGVVNPLPDSSGASQGDVLKIGSDGPEWGVGGGGTTYDAGTGIDIDEYNNISVKLDGNTITVNGQNELEVIGGGGASYSAGAGISIDSNNTISANVDNKTVSADRLSEVSSDYTHYSTTQYLTLNLAENLPTLDASSTITNFELRRTETSGTSYAFSYDTDTQSGLYVRVQIGNTSAFDDAVVTSTRNLSSSSGWMPVDITLDGSNYTDPLYLFKATMGQSNISVGNLFDFSGHTFDEVFDVTGECYIRFVAWDAANQQVVGDPLALTTTMYPNVRFFISSSANPTKLSVKYNTSTMALTSASGLLTVKNPLPSTYGTAGQVLTVNSGANGVEWADALPAFDPSTDVGKVLTVTAYGLEWVTPST